MKVQGVSFLLTFRCNSECKHCAYQAGPQGRGVIDTNNAKRWLKELVETQPLRWLTLHGGEPFLYLELMMEILHLAKELGVPRRGAITNGFWAKDQETARQILENLRHSGLNCITFSVDGFHQEFVPFHKVRQAIEAATIVGFEKVWIDGYYLESLNAENQYDRMTRKLLDELADVDGIEISSYKVDLEGRGANHLIEFATLLDELPNKKCQLPFWLGGNLRSPEVVEIDYEGNVTLCPGICIGSAGNDSILKIIEGYNYREHPIIRVLEEEGPLGLYHLAEALQLNPRSAFADECHLCYEMRRLLHRHYPNHLAPAQCYW